MTEVFRRTAWVRSVLIASLSFAGLSPANAGDGLAGFRTPSGNVHCMFLEGDSDYPANLRCDIMQVDGPLPRPPRDCDGEWGRSFSITHNDRVGQFLCVGDAVFNEDNPVLQYGEVWQQGGFTCTSEESGVSCFNAKRHGFSLSRSSRKVF
jgi:hypothetical protein